ncbi:MAG TPA: hypothetical protein VFA07_19480 [Chthonomonadaceae bacterium]|nr:hypothetical protein [Chthonomonadaceae bacterium]
MDNDVLDRNPWRIEEQDFPEDGSIEEKIAFLLHYAILAPSTRNTQPWKFKIDGETVSLFADENRWLKVSDANQHDLYISLGCALENLLFAAENFGFAHRVEYCPSPLNLDLAATVHLHPGEKTSFYRSQDLFAMIPERHTSHKAYDGEPIPKAVLEHFQRCRPEEGVYLHVTGDADVKRKVDDLTTHADAIEFALPAFRDELAHSIGSGSFGTPWLFAVIEQLAISYLNMGTSTARKDHELLMSSPILGVLSAHDDDFKTWLKVGQTLERLYLIATAHGLCLQPISQLIQVPQIRADLAALLPIDGLKPQLPFRLGYAEKQARHTPRRPLEELLVQNSSPLLRK